MSNYFLGTLTPSPLVRGSSGDTFGTHHSVLGVGGFMEVKTIAERNALPIDNVNGIYYDGISSGQRRLGMLVYVYQDEAVYQLTSPVTYAVWNTYNVLQKQTILSDNNNWTVFLTISGQTYSGERIWKNFSQYLHGFIPGDVIAFDGFADEFIKSTSTNALTYEPLGIVSEVVNSDSFNLTYSGYISTISMTDNTSSPLVAGKVYYVSSTAGKLTLTEPITLAEMSKPMLVTLSDGETGIVLQYNGKKISQDGVTYETFTGYTATTQVFLNKAVTGGTNLGFYNGLIGIQEVKIGYSTSLESNGFYYNLHNYYYIDNTGIVRIGKSPSDNGTRQAFLKNDGYMGISFIKSWIWNEYTGGGGQLGWVVADGNVSTMVGLSVTTVPYAGTPFLNVYWVESVIYYNGTDIMVQIVGSTLTGGTYNNQGPIYSSKLGHDLQFRTIKSTNEDSIKITYDNDCVYLSGGTEAANSLVVNNGLTKHGPVISLGGTLTGETKIIDSDGFGIQYGADYSSTFKTHSLVDKNYADNKTGDLSITNVSGATYIATQLNKAIGGRSSPSGCTIFLPATPITGRPVIVYDKDGVAGTTHNNNITVNGNGKLILGWNSATINTDFGSITFMYNGIFWSVIAFTAEPSYSI